VDRPVVISPLAEGLLHRSLGHRPRASNRHLHPLAEGHIHFPRRTAPGIIQCPNLS
jgi:hypothetical protein